MSGNEYEYKDKETPKDNAESPLFLWVYENVAASISLKQTPLPVKDATESKFSDDTSYYEVATQNLRRTRSAPFKIASDTSIFDVGKINFLQERLAGDDYKEITDVHLYLNPISDETKAQYVVDVVSHKIDSGPTPALDGSNKQIQARSDGTLAAWDDPSTADYQIVRADEKMTEDDKRHSFEDIMNNIFYVQKKSLPPGNYKTCTIS